MIMGYSLSTSVTELKGIGKSRAQQLAKLKIYTLRDLLYYFPRAYENRGDAILLGKHDTEKAHSYILTVASSVSSVLVKKGMTISKLRAFDDSGSCEIIFFNSPFVKDIFHVGDTFRFYGKASFSSTRRLTLISPKYEPIIEGVELPDFMPVYSLTKGITSKFIERLIKDVIDDLLPEIKDPLPDSLRLENNLATLKYALKNIHLPTDSKAAAFAVKRLAFDEMLYFALGISMTSRQKELGEGEYFLPCSLEPLTSLLPYELTNAQKRAINDIYKDTVIKKDGKITQMARILIGDVGCGKTICAAAAMYIAAVSGYQSAIMVPTEILANQHYDDMSELLGRLGVNVELLTGSMTAAQKRKKYEAISSGEIDVIVGTHALLSDKISFKKLGLIVTDEQHRFGVAQRAVLKERQKKAHMLVMSATPIPRTLALALYGDLDISRIDEMPKGRTRVDTYLIDEEYRIRLNQFIRKQISLGGQCYIVCPSIDSEDDDYLSGTEIFYGEYEGKEYLKNVTSYTEELKKRLPDIEISALHGKMSAYEKDAVINSFTSGKTKILVSTTVIEVGVNVPNASLMIIENAERYGLSQLHQLRGRVGRGTRKSYCILVSDAKGEKARQRLEVMKTVYDGFEIAEHDLMIRGPGEFFSSNNNLNLRQSGGLEFKMTSICNDAALLDNAFKSAKKIADDDPYLLLPEHSLLKDELDKTIYRTSTIS